MNKKQEVPEQAAILLNSPFDPAANLSPAQKLKNAQEKANSPPAKYNFLTALTELEEFKTVTDELFFKRLRDFDAEMSYLGSKLKVTFSDLDEKLNKVILKHEQEYSEAYKIMLKRKETDLQVLIDRVREKIAANIFKDEKIKKLEQQITFIRAEAIRLDKSCKGLRDEVAKCKSQLDVMNTDNKFLKEQVLDLNKQNKALKFTLSRLQEQYMSLSTHFQLTEPSQREVNKRTNLIDSIIKAENLDITRTIDQINLSMKLDTPAEAGGVQNVSVDSVHHDPLDMKSPPPLHELTSQDFSQKAASAVLQTIVLTEDQSASAADQKARSVEAEFENPKVSRKEESKISEIKYSQPEEEEVINTGGKGAPHESLTSSLSPRRPVNIPPPSQNLKFKAVLRMLLNAGVSRIELEQELSNYVNTMEHRLNEKVDMMRERLEREKRKQRLLKANMPLTRAIDKNEYETLFFDCVECVRKEVARRKLKGEMLHKRVFMNSLRATHRSVAEHTVSAISREEGDSFIKMARLEELKQSDRIRILDLFVHNEKAITMVFDQIFPSKFFGMDEKEQQHYSLHPSRGKSMSSTFYQDAGRYMLEATREEEENNSEHQSRGNRAKPEFSNPKVSQSIKRGYHSKEQQPLRGGGGTSSQGTGLEKTSLVGSGGIREGPPKLGFMNPLPMLRQKYRTLTSSSNHSFVETPQSREGGLRKEAWKRMKPSFEITSHEQREAISREMQRKKIKPNVYLKSGLIAALTHHKRSYSKDEESLY